MRGRAWPIAIGATALLIVAFYFWTAASSGYSLSTHRYPWEDRFNALADGFGQGHLYLPRKPPAGLLALPDPYDPKASSPFRGGIGSPDSPDFYPVHDTDLYNGHLYITAGPLPAFALFLPWHALGLGWLPNPIAAALFMSLGFLTLTALMLWLVRRFVPEAPPWTHWLCVVAAGLCTVAPYSLRRPLFYDTSQAAGFLIVTLGLLLLAMAVLGTRYRRGLLVAASFVLGLTLLTRQSLVMVPVVLLPTAYWWLISSGRSPDRRSRLLDAAAMAVPVAICAVAVGVYNHQRFDSFTQFGGRYALTSTRPENNFRLANLWPGGYLYLAAPLPLDGTFPFFHVQRPTDAIYPGHLDSGFAILEPTSGIVLTQPLILFLLLLPLVVWRRRMLALPPPLIGLVAAALLAIGLVFVVTAFTNPGTTQRYEQDFLPLLLVLAVLVWLVVLVRMRPGLGRRGLAALGAAGVALGAVISVLTSFTGSDNKLYEAHPNLYLSIADDLGFVSPITDRWGWSTAAEELVTLALVIFGMAVLGLLGREIGRRLPAGSQARARRREAAIALQVVGAVALVLGLVASKTAMGAGRQGALLGGLALVAVGTGLRPQPRRRRAPATEGVDSRAGALAR